MSNQDPQTGSLWVALHDAMIEEVTSDPLARLVSIVVDNEDLRAFAQLRDDVRWRLTLDDAVLLLARTWERWPGPVPDQRGLSRQEEATVVADYQTRARTVSLGWGDFEKAAKSNGIWLKEAHLNEAGGAVILSGYGHEWTSDRYLEFEITGRTLRCERTDIGTVPLTAFLELGEAYWKSVEDCRG